MLISGNSLKVQWLGLHAFIAKGLGSIPGWGTRIPQAVSYDQKKKINKYNKTLILILLLLVSLKYLQVGFNSFNLKQLKKYC